MDNQSQISETALSVQDGKAHRMSKLWTVTRSAFWTVIGHLKRTGVGLVCAVGYFDPYVTYALIVSIAGLSSTPGETGG